MKDLVLDRYEALQERFGTAGLIIAVIALVAALGGSAIALTGAEKKQITKEAKKFSKKFSEQFAKPGPAGAPGANGLPGAAGKDGAPGTAGAAGTAGKSVTVAESAPGCFEGGITVTVEGSASGAEVCNGEEGAPGAIQPNETLPPEVTETGTFIATPIPGAMAGTISFTIPLAAGLDASHVHRIGPEEGAGEPSENLPAGCSGNVENPHAASGNLCVFETGAPTAFSIYAPTQVFVGSQGTGKTGALVAELAEGTAIGSWAVTG